MTLIYRWLWYLLPGNPMLVRIVQGGSRRQRHFWVRLGYLGALIVLVTLGLLTGGGMSGQVGLGELAKAGTQIFSFVAYAQVILICLLSPFFMAGAIAQEQAGKAYDILLTTPMSNLQIVLGSLFGRMFFVWALLFSGLPLFAVMLIFGGVPIASVFIAFAVAGLSVLAVGSVAVMLSVLRTGGKKAVFAFVIAIASYLVAVYCFDILILRNLTAAANTTTFLTPLHPLLVLEASINSANYHPPTLDVLGGYPAMIRFYLARPFETFSVIVLCGSGGLLLFSAIILRRIGQVHNGKLSTTLASFFRTRLNGNNGNGQVVNGSNGAVTTGGERRHTPRHVWANPVAWAEAHTRGNRFGNIVVRWIYALLGVGAGLAVLMMYHYEALPAVTLTRGGTAATQYEVMLMVLQTMLVVEVALVVLVALFMSAGAVSREREDGTLDLLLTTPITPRQYVWGKLRGLVSFLVLLLAVPIVTVAMVSVYAIIGKLAGWESATFLYQGFNQQNTRTTLQPMIMLPEASVLLTLVLVPFVAMCVMVGMTWSIKAKGVLGAVIPSVAIIGVLSLVMGFCGMGFSSVPFVGPVVHAFSPATNLFMILSPWKYVGGYVESETVGRFSLIVATMVAAGGYVVVVWSMLNNIVKRFDQIVRRLSGTG